MDAEINPIVLTKDEQQIRAFSFNNAIIPPQPIYQLIVVNFNNFKANEVKRFKLAYQLI